MLHPEMPVDAVEGERKDAGADQDEQNEGGEPRRGGECGADHLHVEAALAGRHDERADGSHGAAFGGCGDAQENRPENEEDQASGGIRTMIPVAPAAKAR